MPNTQRIFVLATSKNGLTQDEAISKANKEGVTILSNFEVDEILFNKELRCKYISDLNSGNNLPLWTGTLVAYVKKHHTFRQASPEDEGKFVPYTDPKTKTTYRFPVPEKFVDVKGAALVINHGFDKKGSPNFELRDDGNNVKTFHILDKSKIKLLKDFADQEDSDSAVYSNSDSENDAFLIDSEFGIPIGESLPRYDPSNAKFGLPINKPPKNSRGLSMIYTRVGLIIRGLDPFWGQIIDDVNVYSPPSTKCAVLAEKNTKATGKK